MRVADDPGARPAGTVYRSSPEPLPEHDGAAPLPGFDQPGPAFPSPRPEPGYAEAGYGEPRPEQPLDEPAPRPRRYPAHEVGAGAAGLSTRGAVALAATFLVGNLLGVAGAG